MNERAMTMWTVLATLFVLSPGMAATGRTKALVSDEQVPIALEKTPLICRDKIPDMGYGPVPGALLIGPKKIFDRTLRVDTNDGLWVTLPDTTSCADLANQIAALPDGATARRRVYRIFSASWNKKNIERSLEGRIELPLPILIDGKVVVLTATQTWTEETIPVSDPLPNKPFPITDAFVAWTHPQSATQGVGLFCNAAFQGATEYDLSLGEVNGYDSVATVRANVDVVTRHFDSQNSCEDTRAELLDVFTAEDPGNWGTLLPVARTLDLRHRYILDNMGKSTCQEIELETSRVTVEAHEFYAAKSFPIRNVDMQDCLADQRLQLASP